MERSQARRRQESKDDSGVSSWTSCFSEGATRCTAQKKEQNKADDVGTGNWETARTDEWRWEILYSPHSTTIDLGDSSRPGWADGCCRCHGLWARPTAPIATRQGECSAGWQKDSGQHRFVSKGQHDCLVCPVGRARKSSSSEDRRHDPESYTNAAYASDASCRSAA